MRRILLFFLLLYIVSFHAMAGDNATFINLGFADDSRYFMFAQFGITEKGSYPYADLFIVDIQANSFAPYGKKNFISQKSVEPGNHSLGALINLLEQNIALKVKYRIDHLLTGRILYLLVNGETPKEIINFRDFNTGKIYDVHLYQSATGTGKDTESSFHIEVTIKKTSGSSTSLTIGHPAYKRRGVKNYKIKHILLAPDESSLVFVIQKEEIDTTGVNIRYMVETARVSF